MIRIFIVAPTPVLRAGLRSLLSASDIEVTGESASVEDLPFSSSAEVVVLSVAEAGLFPVIGAGLVEQAHPPGLVLLVDELDRAKAGRTLQNLPLPGWAILANNAPGVELFNAVRVVSQGYILFPRDTAQVLFNRQPVYEGLEREPLDEPLTSREQEVLQLLSQGLSNKLIARQLQISEHTVKFHVSSLYTKLEASSRTEAISRGARLGLITL